MPPDIRITAEPIDTTRCRFLVSEPVHAGARRFTSAADASGSPLAEGIFAIPGAGITEVVVSGSEVTVTKGSPAPWTAIGRAVGTVIREALAGARPPVQARSLTPAATGDDDALYERVADIFNTEVNPMVARHGGFVELIDVQERVVMLRMGGGCQGCGMADVTLRQGIEGILRRHLPEVQGIVDVTDHAAGSNPYFSGAKK